MTPAPTLGQRLRFVAVIAAAALAPFACVPSAPAQQEHPGHAQNHDFYRSWMRPHMPSTSCCGAKYDADGRLKEGGDCYPTRAEVRPSALPEFKGALVWWARRDDGKWLEIPEDRYVRYENPDPTGRDAQLCEHHEMMGATEVQLIHCFRPPTGGS